MNRIYIMFLLLVSPLFVLSQGLVNNGAIIKVLASTQVKVDNGNVTNKANGNINNEGNIYLDLDWTQTGATTNYSGNGWMWFEGGANQNVSSVSPLVVPRLRVDNGQVLVLQNSVTVSNQVDLMYNGSIELGNNNLILSPSATMVNYDASNYIITNGNGILQRQVGATDVVFPVGNTSFNPATLNNLGTTDNFQVRVFDQVFDMGTSGIPQTADVVGRTWMIEEEVVGGSLATMTLQWATAEELSVFDRTACGIAHHLGGSTWDNPGAYTAATSVGAGVWSQTRSGFTSFTPFIVRDVDVDLPIELLFFHAERVSKIQVNLDWATASEINNQGFDVERMLDTETEFTKIGWVDGHGTTTSTNSYYLLDPNPHQGVSYYRLKQLDFDGTFSYSPMRAVEGYQNDGGTILVYPVPVKNSLIVDFSNWTESNTDVVLEVIDVYGRTLFSKNAVIQQNTLITIHEVKDLLPGTYFLRATSTAGLNFVRKFTKSEE